MRVLFINNDGGGFADYLEIAAETTVGVLSCEKIPHGAAESYLIRVNRQPAPANQVLQEGDRISFTPSRIEGA